jgi:prepilin-type N-terminal cleavage/methylation domain-containing protein
MMPLARLARRALAFTLLELLVVIAIVAILAAFTLGLVQGSKQRANRARAKAELTHLAQALEDYKRHYGDYPQTGPSAANAQRVTVVANGVSAGPGLNTTPALLFNALIGVYGPVLNPTQGPRAPVNGPTFADVSLLTLEIPFSSGTLTTNNLRTTFAVPTGSPPVKTALNNSFVDPWGNRYLYFYKRTPTAAWTPPAYILFSTGPDGASTVLPAANGLYSGATQTTGDNADNIYADKL